MAKKLSVYPLNGATWTQSPGQINRCLRSRYRDTAIKNVADAGVRSMKDRQPDIAWCVEHDLSRISEEAECFQLGEALRRLWDGTGPLPKVFQMVENDKGDRVLRRCLVTGDRESDDFSERYELHIRGVDDLLNEGQAAFNAGAQHHAQWRSKPLTLFSLSSRSR